MEIEFQSCVVANGPTSDLNEFSKKIFGSGPDLSELKKIFIHVIKPTKKSNLGIEVKKVGFRLITL